MGKKSKKVKKVLTAESPNGSTSVEASPEIDYHRPFSSPYQIPLITLIIGNKHYGIPEAFLLKYPRFPPRSPFSSNITLHDIHEDAGHTLVHFLYSGEYETVNAPLNEATSDTAREYKRSIFVYQASRKYGVTALEALAQRYIQHFGDGMSLPDILRETRDVFSKLPEGETWLPSYIKTRLQRMLEPSEIANGLETFYNSLGQNHHFDSIVLKMVVETLFLRLSFPGYSLENGDVTTAETITTKEFTCKDGSPGEPIGEEDNPPPPVEESAHEDALPGEPTWGGEDAPGPPVEEYVHEDAPPEEPILEADAHHFPVDETAIAEDVHHDEYPAAGVFSSTAEALPLERSIEAVQAQLVRVSTKDLALYKGWGGFTLDVKARRARRLAEKGLPTPNEYGFVPIFVGGAGAQSMS